MLQGCRAPQHAGRQHLVQRHFFAGADYLVPDKLGRIIIPPSLREYAAVYQIDGRRLGPRQLLMHPGPVNRGVELAAEVIDSPQALIVPQVESGVVVRMAVLYELLAGSGTPSASRSGVESAPEPQPA